MPQLCEGARQYRDSYVGATTAPYVEGRSRQEADAQFRDSVARKTSHAGYTGIRMKKAVCLLSGGLDSTTCLALARRDGYACYALSFDYGQRHKIELEAAARVAAFFVAREHRTARIDLRAFGASALTAD